MRPKVCITCKKELEDGSIAKAFGYCEGCYAKLTDGPEMHAVDYIAQIKKGRLDIRQLIERE